MTVEWCKACGHPMEEYWPENTECWYGDCRCEWGDNGEEE